MKIISVTGKILMTGLTVFFILAFIGCFFTAGEDREYYNESILEIHDFVLEPIGTVYQDEQAEDGYSYYRMLFQADNISHFKEYSDYLWRYYSDADDYGSVYAEENDRNNHFRYENQEMIPAGRSAILEDILLIEDGVNQVRVVCENGYDEEEQEWIVSVP